MEWINAATEYRRQTLPHDGRLTALPADWQRELVALMLLDRDVNNGAYLQFYVNHGRDAYEYASRALRAIGARRTAVVIDACQAIIDEHVAGTGTSADRVALLPNEIIGRDGRTAKPAGSPLPAAALTRLRELSAEYMGYPDDVGDLAEAHFGPLIARDRSP